MKWALGVALASVLIMVIPMNSAHADEIVIPSWIKITIKFWSDGKISHTEFVNSLEFLMEKNILKFSGSVNDDILKENEYLKAKAQVFNDESKQLREENEVYRVMLKQEMTQNQLPTSLSKLLDANQKLKSEIQTLRDSNEQDNMYEVDQLRKLRENYEARISQLESDNIEQGKLIQSYQTELNNAMKYQHLATKQFQLEEYEKQIGFLSSQSDDYLVELNYLGAKNLVNEEETKMLRAENEELRILINLMKKGDNFDGLENVKYNSLRNGDQGVVIHNKFDDSLKYDSSLYDIDTSKEYLIFVEPVPEWSDDVGYLVDEAVEFWQSTTDAKFRFVESFDASTAKVSWYKQTPNGYDGFVVREKLVQIGLGNSDCDGDWRPYDAKSIRKVLIHEIGHVMGLKHTNDQTSLMYPVIHDAHYSTITDSYTLGAGDVVFIGACSLNQDPSYQFEVEVQNSNNKIDVFFVPSKNEYYSAVSDKPFQYYSDPNCLGINRSGQVGVCENVSDNAGLLLIAPDSIRGDKITVRVSLAEK